MHKRLIEDDLTRVREKLLLMGGAAEQAIARAVRALIERDSDLAENVVREDDAIDTIELEIDLMCADILVLKQPAASDLRFVISVARTAPVVERIGDHAVNIAKHALELNREPELDLHIDIHRMATVVQEMLIAGLDAFTGADTEKARTTIARDDEVDSLYDQLFARVIEVMERDRANVARGAQWLFILKHLERIADYVTNLCEHVVYMTKGQVIKHKVW